LRMVLPEAQEPGFLAQMREMKERHPYDPRTKLG